MRRGSAGRLVTIICPFLLIYSVALAEPPVDAGKIDSAAKISPARSISDFLTPGGRFDLKAVQSSGYHGPLDLKGVAIGFDPSTGQPIVRASAFQASSEDPDDIYWDNGISPSLPGLDNGVCALTVYDGKPIAGGNFTTAGDVAANYIAPWDGSSWSPLGSGTGGTVTTITPDSVVDKSIFSTGHICFHGVFLADETVTNSPCMTKNYNDKTYQASDADLTDLAAEAISGDFVNTACPWVDNEAADDVYAGVSDSSPGGAARANRADTAAGAESFKPGNFDNPVFEGDGVFYGDIGLANHRNALNIERVYCAPPDYWLGDVANFPGCDSVIPFRACYKDDTNYIKNGKLYPDSIPPLWGGGASDSVRVVAKSCPADSFLIIKDSSYLLHASVVSYPNGWPHLTDSDIVYWDRGKRGFDSSIICWDGHCDSTRKIWVTPRKVYLAATPYNTPHCEGLPNELSNVFASVDGINFTNRLGTTAGDTIRNPLYFASDYILDTLFYYCEYRGADSHWTIYDQRICSTGAYRTFQARAVGLAKADPDIFSAADGGLWLVDVVSFVSSQTHVGTGGLDVPMFDILYTSHTTNGLDWSKVSQVTHASPWISPCVILDTGGTYKMWAVASDKRTWGYSSYDPPWGVYMLTAPRPDTYFTQVGECRWDIPFTMAGCDSVKPFHIDVVKRGLDEYIMIGIGAGAVPGYGCVGGRGEAYYIWIAQSFDGLRWHPGNGGYPIYATQYENAWHGQRDAMWDSSIYRASGFWLDDEQTVLRLYYTGWGGTGSSPHISYMDVRFDGNDSSLAVPLWKVPGNPANDDTKLSIDQRLAGVRYLAIDSAISNSADDTVAFYGMMPFDFQSDSVILYYKTSSATAADIKLDSFWTMVPRYGNLYADSSKPGANLDLASANLSRIAKAVSLKFHSGAEVGICIVVKWGADDANKTVHFAYVALKGRKI